MLSTKFRGFKNTFCSSSWCSNTCLKSEIVLKDIHGWEFKKEKVRFPNNPNTVFHIILLTPLLENNPTLQTGDWRWLTQLFTQYTQYTPYSHCQCYVALHSLTFVRNSTCIIKPNQNDIHNISTCIKYF